MVNSLDLFLVLTLEGLDMARKSSAQKSLTQPNLIVYYVLLLLKREYLIEIAKERGKRTGNVHHFFIK